MPRDRRSFLKHGAGMTLAATSWGCAPWRTAREGTADLVLHGGQVVTMSAGFTVADAIAIRDGRVMAVGSDASMRSHIGSNTEVVNLKGRTALPGINDSHVHGLRTGLSLPPYSLDVGEFTVRSIADVGRLVQQAAAAVPPGSWIRGKGWNDAKFAEGRAPNRNDLDAAAPQNPVVLLDWSNQQLWANSRALKIAGITSWMQAPAGGVIVTDSAGQPTGLLFEAAMALVNAHIPPFTRAEQMDAIEKNISLLLSNGITSYTEAGIGELARGIYEQLAREGKLRVRVTGLLSRADDTYPVSARQVREIINTYNHAADIDPRWFNIAGVKLHADGVPIASRTAWMREPYVGGARGSLVTVGGTVEEKVRELTEMVALVHQAGMQVGTHATGDAAIDAVAAAYAAARSRSPGKHRHYVIRGDFAWPETLRVLAQNDCAINLNPNIKHLIADGQEAVVGAKRAAYESPYASALAAKVVVTSASDSPNVTPNWRQGLETAVLRKGKSGRVSGPEECIGFKEALWTYTTASAWQDHAEMWKGSLEPDKVGDICVLGERILNANGDLDVSPDQLSEIPVALTIVGGSVRYDASSSKTGRP